jgi:fumarylacetoacetase
VELGLPCEVGDYTDFYVGIHHATNVGRQFRPDNPLLPNYKWVPIGYHGRASTLLPAAPFPPAARPVKAPMRPSPCCADGEAGPGAGTGHLRRPANARAHPVRMQEAEAHVFGITLFNDWSARDIQGWEYQPLGPFLSKNFASTCRRGW